MKVFMGDLATSKMVQVFENNWDEEELYIDDPLHHSKCCGDFYAEKVSFRFRSYATLRY